MIVEKGETLINCLAYIDLNPLRAGLVERPEDYRWNTLDSYQFSFAQNAQNIFRPLCKPLSNGRLQRKKNLSTF